LAFAAALGWTLIHPNFFITRVIEGLYCWNRGCGLGFKDRVITAETGGTGFSPIFWQRGTE